MPRSIRKMVEGAYSVTALSVCPCLFPCPASGFSNLCLSFQALGGGGGGGGIHVLLTHFLSFQPFVDIFLISP